jgi:hypothetical protein
LAAFFAILKALWRAVRRDLGTFQSIKVNNFFLFVALLVYGELNSGLAPKGAEPFLLLLGFLLLFSISSDPLDKIPRHRLALWPLGKGQRFRMRLASLALSPVAWITIFIVLKTASVGVAILFVSLAVAVHAMTAIHDPRWNLLLYLPRLPGRLGEMIRHNARQMLSVLDPYLAVLLSVAGICYRVFSPHPDKAAFPILGILIALALSTYAQSLFALDYAGGTTRYRLLPLRGWEILLAKDICFLAILFVLLLPLDPWPGFTFGVAALAIGHHSSVLLRLPQRRWRFTAGRLLPVGALQAIAGIALGSAELQHGALVLVLTGAAYLVSLYWYGRRWDRREAHASNH